ncbi:hypothetical protein HAX54_017812, partial [Datura stramonium]|nr:hypothetical protein [Datura stramonium]
GLSSINFFHMLPTEVHDLESDTLPNRTTQYPTTNTGENAVLNGTVSVPPPDASFDVILSDSHYASTLIPEALEVLGEISSLPYG